MIWELLLFHDFKASLQCIQPYSKVNRMLGVINRSISYKTTLQTSCYDYKSLVRPHLE